MDVSKIMREIEKLPIAEQRNLFALLTEKMMEQAGIKSKACLGKRLSFDEACDVVFRENRSLLNLLAT